ncbi:MAG: hypothetical protein LBJ25_01830, partial [Candidatus Margulisbacteria bacterium]|nr:hypothetical protein [Candidatus Margulisiibacteriota bacterium]
LRGAESSDFTTARGADSQSVILQTTNLPSHSHGATGLSLSELNVSGLKASSGGAHEHVLTGKTASDGTHSHGNNLSVDNSSHGHSLRGGSWGSANCDGLPASYQIAGRNSVYGNDNYYANSPNGTAFISSNTHGHGLSGGVTATDSAHQHGFSSDSKAFNGGAHEHDITGSITGGNITGSIGNTGSGTAFSVATLPVYYTVIYIIKVV